MKTGLFFVKYFWIGRHISVLNVLRRPIGLYGEFGTGLFGTTKTDIVWRVYIIGGWSVSHIGLLFYTD